MTSACHICPRGRSGMCFSLVSPAFHFSFPVSLTCPGAYCCCLLPWHFPMLFLASYLPAWLPACFIATLSASTSFFCCPSVLSTPFRGLRLFLWGENYWLERSGKQYQSISAASLFLRSVHLSLPHRPDNNRYNLGPMRGCLGRPCFVKVLHHLLDVTSK